MVFEGKEFRLAVQAAQDIRFHPFNIDFYKIGKSMALDQIIHSEGRNGDGAAFDRLLAQCVLDEMGRS